MIVTSLVSEGSLNSLEISPIESAIGITNLANWVEYGIFLEKIPSIVNTIQIPSFIYETVDPWCLIKIILIFMYTSQNTTKNFFNLCNVKCKTICFQFFLQKTYLFKKLMNFKYSFTHIMGIFYMYLSIKLYFITKII